MNARFATCLLAVFSLSACDLGQGSKPVSITIIPAGVVNTAGQLQMTECFREPLALQVTFSDGQIGNVTNRATWSSSVPSAVQVSNGDVNIQAIVNGEFDVLETARFTRGLLIPRLPTGTPVKIKANFLGLETELDVVVDALTSVTPQLVPRPVVSDAFTPSLPKFIGEGFAERFTVRLKKNGRIVDAGDFGRNDSIFNSAFNPVRWTFSPAGIFIPPNTADDVSGDSDTFLNNGSVYVPGGTVGADDDAKRAAAAATLTPNGGLVTGVNVASATSLTIQAELSPMDLSYDDADPLTLPVPCGTISTTGSTVTIANLATVGGNQLVLEHEADFNGTGPATGDLVVGTNELLRATALLDTDGTLTTSEQQQDVTAQVDYEIIEDDRDQCITNATTLITTCTSSVLRFGVPLNYLGTFPGTTGSYCSSQTTPPASCLTAADNPAFDANPDIDEVEVRACYPVCASDSNDPVPTVVSNTLAIRAVPARLDSVAIATAMPSQVAFTVPGTQFKAYGTYTAGALDTNGVFQDAGPDNQFSGSVLTASQNIGRYLTWVARPFVDGIIVSDDFSPIAQLTNSGNTGNLEAAGQVFYICNPLVTAPVADRTLDIFASTNNTAVVSNAISDLIVRATLIVDHDPLVLDRACE